MLNSMSTTSFVVMAVVMLLVAVFFGGRAILALQGKLGRRFIQRNGQIGYVGQKGGKGPVIRNLVATLCCIVLAGSAVAAAANPNGGVSSASAQGTGNQQNMVTEETETEDTESTETAEDLESIPNVVVNTTLEEMKLEFADVPQWYSRMCSASIAELRSDYTDIGDAFAMPLYVDLDWIDQGSRFERTDTEVDPNKPATISEEDLNELVEARMEELKEMTPEELNAFYNSQIRERMLRIPQYQLAFANLARKSPLIMENNSELIEKYFRFVAKCNEIKLADFSAEFQKNFEAEGSFDKFLEEVLRDPTEKELKAGKREYKDIDLEVLDQFYDELAEMPLGLDECLQYESEHKGDIRYLEVTDKVREFGMYFYKIMEYMPSYGVKVMTSTHNWISPQLRADDRLLKVVEADYQENVPDKNGKIKDPHEAFWMWFPLKNGTNCIFAGVNLDDGRFMLAEPVQPDEPNNPGDPGDPGDPGTNPRKAVLTIRYLEEGTNQQLLNPTTEYITPGTTFDRYPAKIPNYTCVNPDAGKNQTMPKDSLVITFFYKKDSTTRTQDYALTVICNDEAGHQLQSYDAGRHKAGESVNINHPDIGGYTFSSGPSTHTMPNHDDTVVLVYKKNGDSEGGKTPTDGSSQNNNAPIGGGDNKPGDGDGEKQNYDAEKAEADRIAAEAEEAERQRQEAEEAARKAEEERKQQEEEAARKEQENAQNQGQGGGITTENGQAPQLPSEEVKPPKTDWETTTNGANGTTTTTTTNAATGQQTTQTTQTDSSGNATTTETTTQTNPNHDVSGTIVEPPLD